MKRKYPVLKCTKELWKEIKLVLLDWNVTGFINISYNRWDEFPYLISNFGNCTFDNFIIGNSNEPFVDRYDSLRYLVNTKEEFLTDVAKLLGKEYPIKKEEMKKIIIGGIEIKPGMLLYLDDADINSNDFFVVFPYKNGLGIIPYNKNSWGWLRLENMINKVTAIRDIYDKSTSIYINSGKILWRKSKKVTITKQQIADKFGIDIKQLKIIE